MYLNKCYYFIFFSLLFISCLPILSIMFSFSHFMYTFSVFISFQTAIDESDILDILEKVPLAELGDLYTRLGLSSVEVDNAKLDVDGPRAKEKHKKVLLRWINTEDKAATRDVILKAMSKISHWKRWMNQLREKWGYPRV